jgi:hypothetical protein
MPLGKSLQVGTTSALPDATARVRQVMLWSHTESKRRSAKRATSDVDYKQWIDK